MNLEAKKKTILDHEVHMANRLAGKVIYKPTLSIWMILIPVIFVYYFWRLQKFATGKRQFVQHWMRERIACIEEAFRVAGGQEPTPVRQMVPEEHMPPAAVAPYTRWVECLLQHYVDLMLAQGGSRPELVRRAYRKQGNYLLFLNQLNGCEQDLNAALLPELDRDTPGVGQAARQIEQWCRMLRREDAEKVFGIT